LQDFTHPARFFRAARARNAGDVDWTARLEFGQRLRRRPRGKWKDESGAKAHSMRWKRFVPRKTMRSTQWRSPRFRPRTGPRCERVIRRLSRTVQRRRRSPPTLAPALMSGDWHTLQPVIPEQVSAEDEQVCRLPRPKHGGMDDAASRMQAGQ